MPSKYIIPKTDQIGFGLVDVNLTDDLLDIAPNNKPDDICITIKLDKCSNMMQTQPLAVPSIERNEARLCLFDTETRLPVTSVWHVPSICDHESNTWDFNNAEHGLNSFCVRLEAGKYNNKLDKVVLVIECIVWF